MFKSIIFGSLLVAAVLAFDVEDLNKLEYNAPPHRGLSLPYAYQESRDRRVVEPYYYDSVLVPAPVAPKAVGVIKLGLIATVASFAVSLVKSAFVFFLVHGPALVLGVIATLGLCKLTPICSKLSSVKSLLDAQKEFRSLATPERIAGATEFVQKAIRKYRSMQTE